MRRRDLLTLMAVAPVWIGLYFWAGNIDFQREGWLSPFPPEFDHIRMGVWVAVIATILGIGLLTADFIQWLGKKVKAND
jgi:hypothetical protein